MHAQDCPVYPPVRFPPAALFRDTVSARISPAQNVSGVRFSGRVPITLREPTQQAAGFPVADSERLPS